MRYHFIDKIRSIDIDHSIVTIKNATVAEDYFEEHFVGFPVVPGALQIEAIAQACGALIEISSDYRLFSVLLMVEKMKFKKMVHPGDQMIITCTQLSRNEDSALFEAKIEVDGKIVTTGRIMTGIISLESKKYNVAKVMETLKQHYTFLLRDTVINHQSSPT